MSRHFFRMIRLPVGMAGLTVWLFSKALLGGAVYPDAPDFNGDHKPDILWHYLGAHSATVPPGACAIWTMNGVNLASGYELPATSDLGWKIVGTGDFNLDGHRDILWRHETIDMIAVWYMVGTEMTSGVVLHEAAPGQDWRITGAADFNADGKTDILLQNRVNGAKVIWIMDGISLKQGTYVESSSTEDWQIAGTGDFNGDGKPDLILSSQTTRQTGIWLMNGTAIASRELVWWPNATAPAKPGALVNSDGDWQIVGSGDYSGDGKTDLLLRHVTDGRNAIWKLSGTNFLGAEFLSHMTYDTDWRMGTQNSKDSLWRIGGPSHRPEISVSITTNPPAITLHLDFDPLPSGGSFTIQRRAIPGGNWRANPDFVTVGAGITSTTFRDTNVQPGLRYEYRAYVFSTVPAFAVAGINAAPIEDRGRVILLVDQSLVSGLGSALTNFIQNLVGDGWQVLRHDVPRHVDDYSSSDSYRIHNYSNVMSIKSLVQKDYAADTNKTRCVVILGHVAIPYSGYRAEDGHEDHRGAWPADMFYADVDGVWTDTNQTSTLSAFRENWNYPGDGKFDNDQAPSALEMAVGRIDFARLPEVQRIQNKTEIQLLLQYLQKNHRFRHGQSPYPLLHRSVIYNNFSNGDRSDGNNLFISRLATRNTKLLYGTHPDSLAVREPFRLTTKSAGWAFTGGPGFFSGIYGGAPFLEFTTQSRAAQESPVNFYVLLGSYFGDHNLSDNFGRAVLASPGYGLATIWTRFNTWNLDAVALGEPLAESYLRTFRSSVAWRNLEIVGDPTLPNRTLASPAKLTATSARNTVYLSWPAGEAGSSYYIYRSANVTGPFVRLTPNGLTNTNYADYRPPKDQKIYMLRALKTTPSGTGSYVLLSQGVFATSR